MKKTKGWLVIGIVVWNLLPAIYGQSSKLIRLCIEVKNDLNEKLTSADILVNNNIRLTNNNPCHFFEVLPESGINIVVSSPGYMLHKTHLIAKKDTTLVVRLEAKVIEIKGLSIIGGEDSVFAVQQLASVDNMTIYAGKKHEVILPANLAANVAVNNSRQVFGRIPGLNIWDNDRAGLQMAIGARGLDPNRLSNFNIRQNGYDISADPLGYPESYYTPPLEAVERIVLIRGAASLQFGPQFGGMLNFQMKTGDKNRPVAATIRHTLGSWGLNSTYFCIGGTPHRKISYYSFVQRKTGQNWRPNSHFEAQTAYAALKLAPSDRLTLKLETTFMHYLAQMPGGLTDKLFYENPALSLRNRNFFQVNWLLLSALGEYKFSELTSLRISVFGLLAGRDALGVYDRINMIDLGRPRTLIRDNYRNYGLESTFLQRYGISDSVLATLVLGARYFHGRTHQRQGFASKTANPDFNFTNPSNPENSYYQNPSENISLFLEHVFFIGQRLTITPGARIEHILTGANGHYNILVTDLAGNLIQSTRNNENRTSLRTVFIGGIGATYDVYPSIEVYGNFSQNYRPVNFSDMRIQNPNERIDPNLSDERGFNADLGMRGKYAEWLIFDISLFYLRYANRIGQIYKSGEAPLYLPYRFRTNMGASRSTGLELFTEANIWRLFSKSSHLKLLFFTNTTLIHGIFTHSERAEVRGRFTEYTPPVTLRQGLTLRYGKFMASFQHTYVARQFSDATNATFSASAVIGIIPSYKVADLSMRYQWRWFGLETGCNNLFNAAYFTQRAAGYAGPGILPSLPRNVYVTFEVNSFKR